MRAAPPSIPHLGGMSHQKGHEMTQSGVLFKRAMVKGVTHHRVFEDGHSALCPSETARPGSATVEVTVLLNYRRVVMELCFSKLERPPTILAGSLGSPPATSFSPLSVLGCQPSCPHPRREFRSPHPLRHPLHCPNLSLESKGEQYFLAPKHRVGLTHLFLGMSQRGHQAGSSGPTRAEASLLSFFLLAWSVPRPLVLVEMTPSNLQRAWGLIQGGGSQLPLHVALFFILVLPGNEIPREYATYTQFQKKKT